MQFKGEAFMSNTYKCSVQIYNKLMGEISNVKLVHHWTGDPGQYRICLADKVAVNSYSDSYDMTSGTDGYDYWSIFFQYGGYYYGVSRKRCSLKTKDKGTSITFMLWLNGSEIPCVDLGLTSGACSAQFKVM
jgi:hypothetical protein